MLFQKKKKRISALTSPLSISTTNWDILTRGYLLVSANDIRTSFKIITIIQKKLFILIWIFPLNLLSVDIAEYLGYSFFFSPFIYSCSIDGLTERAACIAFIIYPQKIHTQHIYSIRLPIVSEEEEKNTESARPETLKSNQKGTA